MRRPAHTDEKAHREEVLHSTTDTGWACRSDHTTLVVLAVSLVLVVLVFAVHYRQEVSYWEELELAVRAERAARLDALAAVATVQQTASHKVCVCVCVCVLPTRTGPQLHRTVSDTNS